MPNNKCAENIDHHDHENEIQHLHQHQLGYISSAFENLLSTNTTYDTIISSVLTNNSNNSQLESYFTNKFSNKNHCKPPETKTWLDSSNSSIASVNQKTNKVTNDLKIEELPQNLINNKNPCLFIEDGDHEVEVKTFTKNKHSGDERSSHLSIAHGHSNGHKYKSSREKAHHEHHMKHEREITDIKLIAWMVLMGDGLHNFADGLAIGASFASSLTAGFGTSIAVLCHELPHEIGDFAVLRRAGVSLTRALVFNALSGVLCCIGTFVGLIIGSYPAFTNLAFLFIAGVFLYISLVDMVTIFFSKFLKLKKC